MNANNTGNTSERNTALKGLAFQFPSKHEYCKQNSMLFIMPGPEIHTHVEQYIWSSTFLS